MGIGRLIALTLLVMPTISAWAAVVASSDHQHYRIVMAPATAAEVPLRSLHAWTVRLETSVGVVFMPTELTVNGGMPGHGHGLPAVPEITRLLPSGDLLLEGVLFNMSGRWRFQLGIDGPAGWDTATIEFELDDAGRIAGETVATDLRTRLRPLAINALGAVPPDPTNAVAGSAAAAQLGQALFFEPRLSGSGSLSCASCHVPGKAFTDGRAQALGAGHNARNTPDLIGVAWRPWMYWDGRRDSLWAQALIPLEAPIEMGSSRVQTVQVMAAHPNYRKQYEDVFGPLPAVDDLPSAGPIGTAAQIEAWNRIAPNRRKDINRAFSNVGKALAAYERRIVPSSGRFDAYVNDGRELSADELAGMNLFLDGSRTLCMRCHNGPLFTNHGFHNIGTGGFEGEHMDFGRVFGLQAVLMDEFNCLGPYSDGTPDDCAQLTHAPRQDVPEEYSGAFKVPGLRNLSATAPYMHDGRYATLEEVIEHYRRPPPAALAAGELTPIAITDDEARQLVAFLRALDGGYRIFGE